ncbi:MAG: DUF362 domain-containing protein [Nanoarchaeota archaeon]|nr:DUF362 domain-containing protein [Nanoarchaeota archaeon]
MKISTKILKLKKSNKQIKQLTFTTPKKSTVSKHSNLTTCLKKINGLNNVKGKVLIKVNLNSDDKYPGTSNPKTLSELIKLLQKKTKKIFVGDRSSIFWEGTRENAEKVGITQATEKAGAEMVYFENHPWIKTRDFWITEKILDYDHVINLAVLKTHRIAGITLSLKNMMGITHPRTRLFMHAHNLNKKIARINTLINPTINIIDGTKCFIDGGPDTGVLKQGKIILASKDRIALDVISFKELQQLGSKSLARKNPWKHPQIKEAVKLKLGVNSDKKIIIK